jgi:hypothetical protein
MTASDRPHISGWILFMYVVIGFPLRSDARGFLQKCNFLKNNRLATAYDLADAGLA